jgi:hypothetical protein
MLNDDVTLPGALNKGIPKINGICVIPGIWDVTSGVQPWSETIQIKNNLYGPIGPRTQPWPVTTQESHIFGNQTWFSLDADSLYLGYCLVRFFLFFHPTFVFWDSGWPWVYLHTRYISSVFSNCDKLEKSFQLLFATLYPCIPVQGIHALLVSHHGFTNGKTWQRNHWPTYHKLWPHLSRGTSGTWSFLWPLETSPRCY